jgi:hypothetical protein
MPLQTITVVLHILNENFEKGASKGVEMLRQIQQSDLCPKFLLIKENLAIALRAEKTRYPSLSNLC